VIQGTFGAIQGTFGVIQSTHTIALIRRAYMPTQSYLGEPSR
jgi:hypothetical protein